MIKHYQIKDYPKIKEVISIDDLDKLNNQNGFLVFIIDSLNVEEANDLVEELGIRKVQIACVVSTSDMTVYEVCDKLEKESTE